MFRAKTVLIIGAGASFEVGLPIGTTLLERIVEMTAFDYETFGRIVGGDPQIVSALKLIFGNDTSLVNEHLLAGHQLGTTASQGLSIDNVIDALEDPKIELLGKLGIARAILAAEAESPVFKHYLRSENFDLSNFADTWYSSLTKILCDGIRKSQIGSIFDNLEIINFNYDRCLEHYLQHSLASYYGVDLEASRRIVNTLVIHRPYGMTGRLPWRTGEGDAVDFGNGGAANLVKVVGQIRTFTEQIEEGERLEAIRNAVRSADRIVFLGFGFHPQNVQLISADIGDDTEVLATTFKISHPDQGVIETELAVAFGYEYDGDSIVRAQLAPLKCNAFFSEYRRTLMSAAREY